MKKSIDTLAEIDLIFNGNGGDNFLKIRWFLDDVDKRAEEGSNNAILFKKNLEDLCSVLNVVIQHKWVDK